MANGLKVLLKNANVINAKVLLPKVDFSEDTIEPSHVLAGDTYHDENGKNVGTMPINESEAVVFSSASDTYRIAEGYHDGTGTVSIERQDGLIPGKILEDTTILGVKGNIPILSAENVSFQTLNDTYTISRGYYNNGGTIRIAPNPQLVPSNLLDGVTVLGVEGNIPINTATTTVLDMADARYAIPQGYHDGNGVVRIAHFADLVPENLLEGTSVLGVDGNIPINEAESITLVTVDDEYEIPEGYHNGSGKVGIAPNPDLISNNILEGKTILGVQGGIPANKSETIVFSSIDDQYVIPEGYHNGNGVVRIAQNDGLASENILEGVNILGVEGSIPINVSEEIIFSSVSDTYTVPRGFHDGTGIVRIASNPDLVSENILSRKTILGIQGNIPVITPESVTFDSADDEYVIPRGYHDGTERVSIENNPDLLPENIKAGVTILGVTGTLATLPDGDEMLFGDPTANIVGVGQSGSMIVTEPGTDAFADYGVVDSAIVL